MEPLSASETAGTVALGTVLGGTLVRFLVNKWLKDREDFERIVTAEMKALVIRVETSKDYADRGLEALRKESAEARHVLREHFDREDTILRERTHTIDTRTQVIVNNMGLMREEIKGLVAAQGETTAALHEVDKTLARLADGR